MYVACVQGEPNVSIQPNLNSTRISTFGRIQRLDSSFLLCSNQPMAEWGELSFKVVRLEKAGQEVLARAATSWWQGPLSIFRCRCIKPMR